MADPFSLTANVVGVISLGLSVCQGLVTYCSHIKSFNNDNNNVATKIRGFKDTLEALKDILSDQDAFDPKHTTDRVKTMIRSASQTILDCDAALKKLKNALEDLKIDSESSSRKSQKAKEYLGMALYPFRRDGLMNHIVTVEGLQYNLSMALDLLKM
ncbi:hypothetical protein N7540_012553 [Penicillium herquei]|nr:hypothetical protein N7540_012553 [Penicillium herquei]